MFLTPYLSLVKIYQWDNKVPGIMLQYTQKGNMAAVMSRWTYLQQGLPMAIRSLYDIRSTKMVFHESVVGINVDNK